MGESRASGSPEVEAIWRLPGGQGAKAVASGRWRWGGVGDLDRADRQERKNSCHTWAAPSTPGQSDFGQAGLRSATLPGFGQVQGRTEPHLRVLVHLFFVWVSPVSYSPPGHEATPTLLNLLAAIPAPLRGCSFSPRTSTRQERQLKVPSHRVHSLRGGTRREKHT